MRILVATCVLFCVAMVAHLIIWRVRLPGSQIKALLIIFNAVLGIGMIGAVACSVVFTDLMHIALFYESISLSYFITYSAIEGDSPTLSLIRLLAESHSAGVPAHEVAHFLAQRPFVKTRLAALVTAGLIREQTDRYFLAGKGSLAFRLILGYRKLYGPIYKGG